MPRIHALLLPITALFTAATFSAATGAQSDSADKAPNLTFRQSTIARCEQQYSVEQCQDEQFLEDNFHINSLEVAHRTAARRNQIERDALRELTLQRVCDRSPSSVCASADDPTRCAEEIVQSCSMLAARAATCEQNAQLVCANDAASSTCVAQ